MEMDKL